MFAHVLFHKYSSYNASHIQRGCGFGDDMVQNVKALPVIKVKEDELIIHVEMWEVLDAISTKAKHVCYYCRMSRSYSIR